MDFSEGLVQISLRRQTSDKSWGFGLQGGSDQGLPVFVQKITRNGLAHKAGLEPGDIVVKICQTHLTGMAHAQVKAEILRAGNDLDFYVRKHGFDLSQYNASLGITAANAAPPSAAAGGAYMNQGGSDEAPRSEIVEEHVWKHGGPTFKNVQPKSYKILEQQLPSSESGGALPSSIFGDNTQQRSGYLKATEPSIQKVFGES